jgi:hypothetical protein
MLKHCLPIIALCLPIAASADFGNIQGSYACKRIRNNADLGTTTIGPDGTITMISKGKSHQGNLLNRTQTLHPLESAAGYELFIIQDRGVTASCIKMRKERGQLLIDELDYMPFDARYEPDDVVRINFAPDLVCMPTGL